MRRASGLRMSSYVRVAGIVLIVVALFTPMTDCVYCRYRPIPDPGPSLDLEIRTWYDLDAVRDNLAGHHRLMNDLDSTTAGYEELAGPRADGGRGWERLGTGHINDPNFYLAFTGTFDGQGHEIRGLFQSRIAGLFGYVAPGGVIENLAIVDATVMGHRPVAALAAVNDGTVSNCSSSGNVTGDFSVGGLVGHNRSSGAVNNCYSRASVVGRQLDAGGLVGENGGGSVSNSYATGSVTGGWVVGGLVGRNVGGTVSNSYATGPVTAPETSHVGGFVGRNRGIIVNCYSTGSVHFEGVADPMNKGFAGSVDTGGSYKMAGNFWDLETSGQNSTAGDATGKTTAEMMDIATFTDTATEGLDQPWDMIAVAPGETNDDYVWNIADGESYPFLSWQVDYPGAASVAEREEMLRERPEVVDVPLDL